MSNQDQAVKAWMHSLGFRPVEGTFGTKLYRKEDAGFELTHDEALFFYTICQKVEREAEIRGRVIEASRQHYSRYANEDGCPFCEGEAYMAKHDEEIDHIQKLEAKLTPSQDTNPEEKPQ